MINNRQNGRRRGRGGGNSGGGNGPRQGGSQGRGDNGNRVDSRARGNAPQLLEKYKNLASDAQRQGDRVNTEYYLQFADHYFRVLADQRGRFEDQQPQQRRQQNDFDMDGDGDYGDEGEAIRAGEQQNAGDDDRYQEGRQQDGRQQDGRQQDGRQQQARRPDQGDASRWEQHDNRGERDNRADRGERNGGERNGGERHGAGRSDPRPEVAGQHRSDPPMPREQPGARAEEVLEADAPTPRRRGRPRRDAGVTNEGMGAEAAGGGAAGVDADRLPPSLGLPALAGDADAGEPKPRRRRTPRGSADGAPAAE